MRASYLLCLFLTIAAIPGCQDRGEYGPPPEPRGGVSLRPLSTQSGADVQERGLDDDGGYYPDAAPGMYQQTTVATVVEAQPVVTGGYYAAPGGIYTDPVSYQAPVAPVPTGRPLTFAERRMAQPSPYAPLFNQQPRVYSAPVTYTTIQPVPAAPTVPAAPVPAATYTAVPTQDQPVTTVTTYTTTTPITTQTTVPSGQFTYLPASTTYYGEMLVIPEPPRIIRDETGQVQTFGYTDRMAPVRLPAQYAPGYAGPTVTTTTYPTPSPIMTAPASSSPSLSSVVPVPSYPVQMDDPLAGTVLTPEAIEAGLRLVPAPDIPPGNHPNDAGPSQWFEIIRPGNGPIRIGRVSSTCICVGVRVPNRFVGAGERALIEARTITRPPYNNLTYGMYVSVLEPVNKMLDVDVTISL